MKLILIFALGLISCNEVESVTDSKRYDKAGQVFDDAVFWGMYYIGKGNRDSAMYYSGRLNAAYEIKHLK